MIHRIKDDNEVTWLWDTENAWLDIEYPAGETPEPGSGWLAIGLEDVIAVLVPDYIEDEADLRRQINAFDAVQVTKDVNEVHEAEAAVPWAYFDPLDNSLTIRLDDVEAIPLEALDDIFTSLVGHVDTCVTNEQLRAALEKALNLWGLNDRPQGDD